jgi:HD-like signal output (HDOD) protein
VSQSPSRPAASTARRRLDGADQYDRDSTRPDEVAAKAGDLPALPVVAIRVINLTAQSQTSGEELEAEILRDQALVTRVLRLANSAAYGVRGTIATVSRAIFILGFDMVRSLVLAACAETLYRRGGSGFSDTVLWDHVRGAAFLSRLLADKCAYPGGEQAFIAGLVHDVGKVVMDRNLRDPYEKVIALVESGESDSFVEAERDVLGFDHTEVGCLVAQKWGLPEAIAEAVRHHHDPEHAVVDPQLCAIVSLANSACVKLQLGLEQQPDLDLASLTAAGQLGASAELLDLLMERGQEYIDTEIES